ncbi:PREDICTED: uncharacterized protein LOC104718919 [Camelina sativa]|uniref:Uncharacterized protein LOC104718919 n=1 Tax=Camelina sativa TaxID=90675 RepID=A0ABM0U2Z5_CAMSA|nr:PREDICTED: uncharacterized protein LOC104718919 [Camelina sativa]
MLHLQQHILSLSYETNSETMENAVMLLSPLAAVKSPKTSPRNLSVAAGSSTLTAVKTPTSAASVSLLLPSPSTPTSHDSIRSESARKRRKLSQTTAAISDFGTKSGFEFGATKKRKRLF